MEIKQEEFDKILLILTQKGVKDTDLSMFSEEDRIQLLKKAAEHFFVEKNYNEAINAYGLTGDKESLNKLGDSFLKASLLANALYAYQVADNKTMVLFIKANFDESDYAGKLYVWEWKVI